jgi:hypothetical protein
VDDKSFISRWSRLKSERAAQTPESTDAAEAYAQTSSPPAFKTPELLSTENYHPVSADQSSELNNELNAARDKKQEAEQESLSTDESLELTEPPPLTDKDMPPIESLSEESDFTQFFSSGVSEELRNLALRSLFKLPQFNIRDGLNDYDEDFSKIPVLAKEVAAKLRSWLHEKQDELTDELKEELMSEEKQELTEEISEETVEHVTSTPPAEAENATVQLSPDTNKEPHPSVTHSLTHNNAGLRADAEDDLGDADLEG